MQRIREIDPHTAPPATRALFDAVEERLGSLPNVFRTMGSSPVVLEGYLRFSSALGRSSLSAQLREQIALAVAEASGCEYCLAAHGAIGKTIGLSEEAVADARRGSSPDRRVDAVLHFARRLVSERGRVSDADVNAIRSAGFSDTEITELVASVSLNLFTNYFNLVARTAVDFPKAQKLAAS